MAAPLWQQMIDESKPFLDEAVTIAGQQKEVMLFM